MIYLLFFWYLLITAAVEGAVILIVFRRKLFVYYSLLCNLLTNPAMNLLLLVFSNVYGPRAYYPALLLLEVAVVAIEAGVYRFLCGFGPRKCVLLSLGLNASSFAVGLAVNYFMLPFAQTLHS